MTENPVVFGRPGWVSLSVKCKIKPVTQSQAQRNKKVLLKQRELEIHGFSSQLSFSPCPFQWLKHPEHGVLWEKALWKELCDTVTVGVVPCRVQAVLGAEGQALCRHSGGPAMHRAVPA